MNLDNLSHKNLTFYYISQALVGLRFMAPVWVLFFSHYLTLGEIGVLESIGLLTTMVLELPSGALADLIGRKYSVFIGYILAGLGFTIIGFAHSFSGFLVGYIINSIGTAFVSGADTALIYDTLKEHNREQLYSKVAGRGVFYNRLFFIFASIIGQYLYIIFFGLPYIVLGIVTFFAAILYLLMIEPVIDSEKFTIRLYMQQITSGAHEAFKDQMTKRVSFYFLTIASIELILLWFYNAPFLVWIGYTEKNLGWVYAAMATLRMIVSYFSHEIEIILGEKRLVLGLPLLLGIILCFGFIRNVYIGTLVFAVQYSLFVLRYTILDKYTNAQFDSKYRAAAISTLNMFVSLIYAGVIFGAGRFVALNNVGVMFSLLGIVLFVIGVPLGYLLSNKRTINIRRN